MSCWAAIFFSREFTRADETPHVRAKQPAIIAAAIHARRGVIRLVIIRDILAAI